MKKRGKQVIACFFALLMLWQMCMAAFAYEDEEMHTVTLVKNFGIWTPPGMDTTWSRWLNDPEVLTLPRGTTISLDCYYLETEFEDAVDPQNGVYKLQIKPTSWESSYNHFSYHVNSNYGNGGYTISSFDDTLYAFYNTYNGLELEIYTGEDENYWTHWADVSRSDRVLMPMDPEWTYTVDGVGPAYQLPGEEDMHRDGYILDGWQFRNETGTVPSGTILQKNGIWYYVFDPVTWDTVRKRHIIEPIWKPASHDQLSVTIGDQIGVNLLLDLDARNAENVTVVYKDLNGDEQRETFTDFSSLPKTDDGLYKIAVQIAPAQIADTVTVYIDGEQLDACVKDYCNTLTAGGYEPEVVALAQAVLDYGQAANNFFDYTDETISAVTNLSADDAKAWTPVFADTTGKIRSISFMALTKPEFRFYMRDIAEVEAAAYNAAGVAAAYADTDVTETLHARFVKNLNGDILIEVTGVMAEYMDETIVVTIDDLGTITFAGNDFAKLMANNAATEALGAALYAYGAAAKVCFRPEVDTVDDGMEVPVTVPDGNTP